MSRPTTIERKAKEAEIKEKEERVKIDMEKVKIEKLSILKVLLQTEKPIIAGIGEFNKYELFFDDSEQETIKAKIFEILHKL